MAQRHDLKMAGEVNTTLGLLFAAGPEGFLAFCALGTVAALALVVLNEPGRVFCGAMVLLLPILAWRVGRVRNREGRLGKGRIAMVATLLLGAVLSYQLQWGALGDAIHKETCDMGHLGDYGPSSQATSWFLGCRRYLTKEQTERACNILKASEGSNTFRLRLAC